MKYTKYILILVLIFLIPIVIIYSQKDNITDNKSIQILNKEETNTVNVSLVANQNSVSAGESLAVSIVLPTQLAYSPSVFDIYLKYNDEIFTLESTEAGLIWTESNILANSNKDGVLNLIVGQNFEAVRTNNSTLATFYFEVNDAQSGKAEFSLSPESSYASTETDSVILLNSNPLQINLE